jgi:hypothetical protein
MNIIHFKEMVKLLELDKVIKYRNKYNPSGKLPYHCNKHMDFMLSDCINSYLYDLLWDRGNGPVLEYTAIFYAAIFHDVNHSGGKLTDNLNVDKAIEAWRAFADSADGSKLIFAPPHSHHRKMITTMVPILIRATQYPYVDVRDSVEYTGASLSHIVSLTDSCNVLRDADLMSAYHGDAGMKLVNNGLYREMSSGGSIYGPMTYAEYVDKQAAFLNKITWHSAWGKRRAEIMNFPNIVKAVIDDAEQHKDSDFD